MERQIITAERGGVPEARLIFRVLEDSPTPTVWIEELSVPENLRRKGLAQKLIAELCKYCRDAAIRVILGKADPLDDTCTTEALCEIHRRLGFRIDESAYPPQIVMNPGTTPPPQSPEYFARQPLFPA